MKKIVWEILETAAIAAIIFLIAHALVQTYEVRGSSMESTLHNGQFLVVNKAAYFNLGRKWVPFAGSGNGDIVYIFHPPRRGEVIVFDPPIKTDEAFIKRVIGLPGETIEIKRGTIYINGVPLKESLNLEPPNDTMPPLVIPPDSYFVMGDNRSHSNDSRSWGTVPRKNIVGKAWISLWPAKDWGLVPNYALADGDN